jgi:hypothetical protein
LKIALEDYSGPSPVFSGFPACFEVFGWFLGQRAGSDQLADRLAAVEVERFSQH